MSALSRKPSIPRPVARRVEPLITPSSYVGPAPIIRDRLPTLELADEDMLVVEPLVRARPTPPPPPPPRRIAPPKLVVVPVSQPAARGKLESVLDPTDVLFDCMYELNFIESAWQAGSVCARVLGGALRARAVVIHAHDLASHELRII